MWLTRQERDGDGGIGGRCLHTIGLNTFLHISFSTLVTADACMRFKLFPFCSS
jgi:hypothetical protein